MSFPMKPQPIPTHRTDEISRRLTKEGLHLPIALLLLCRELEREVAFQKQVNDSLRESRAEIFKRLEEAERSLEAYRRGGFTEVTTS